MLSGAAPVQTAGGEGIQLGETVPVQTAGGEVCVAVEWGSTSANSRRFSSSVVQHQCKQQEVRCV